MGSGGGRAVRKHRLSQTPHFTEAGGHWRTTWHPKDATAWWGGTRVRAYTSRRPWPLPWKQGVLKDPDREWRALGKEKTTLHTGLFYFTFHSCLYTSTDLLLSVDPTVSHQDTHHLPRARLGPGVTHWTSWTSLCPQCAQWSWETDKQIITKMHGNNCTSAESWRNSSLCSRECKKGQFFT